LTRVDCTDPDSTIENTFIGGNSIYDFSGTSADAIQYTLDCTTTFTGVTTLTGGGGGNTFYFFDDGNIRNLNMGAGNDTIYFGADSGGCTTPTANPWNQPTGDIQTNCRGQGGNNTFIFYDNYFVTSGLNGGTGGGTNILQGPPGGSSWTISSANGGTIDPMGPVVSTAFSSMATLTGGVSGSDIFTFTTTVNHSPALTINGNSTVASPNTLQGPDGSNLWTITADNAGNLLIQATATTVNFSNIHNLIGGTLADRFNFNGAFRLEGTTGIDGNNGSALANTNIISGAASETNTFTLTTDDNTGTIDITGQITNFSNIQKIIGGTSAANELIGRNAVNIFTISGSDSGDVNTSASLLFENIANLTGGPLNDTFRFNGTGTLSGAIDGGTNTGGNGNVINTALATGPLTIALGGGSGIVNGGITNIQTIIGGTQFETLKGRDIDTTWTITAPGSGTVANTSALDVIAFEQMDVLQGGSADDTFTLTMGISVIVGGINGNGGTNTLIASTGVDNIWNITSTNTGSITPSGGVATPFSTIRNLTGGDAKDTFVLSDNAGITGFLAGGSSCTEGNVLDYSAYTTIAESSMPPCSAGPGTATNILGGISYISKFIPAGGEIFTPARIAEGKAYIDEIMLLFDFKNFVEFNDFLNRYTLIYIKKEKIDIFDSKYKPIFLDKFYKRKVKSSILR
jgi:hypothetical protein